MNEPGPELRPEDWERYVSAVAERLGEHDVLACSGSLPPGAPPDAYARLAVLAAEAGAIAIVDVTGAHLAAAVAAGAGVVTPNIAEAEGLLHGRADETVEAGDPAVVRARAEAAAAELVARGARRAVVTAAAAGAAVADGDRVGWIAAPRASVRNPVGAGDALVGGLGTALERGEPFARAVAHGVAAAAASVETPTAGTLDAGRAAALFARDHRLTTLSTLHYVAAPSGVDNVVNASGGESIGSSRWAGRPCATSRAPRASASRRSRAS